ncbi:GSCOCG00003494001-RA-CDS [Cotesia congregata]|nr:GSCOCG00003494001-RA-CDS [Cotesia congregata]
MPLRRRKKKIIIENEEINKENIKKKKINKKKIKSSTDISVLSYDNLRSIFSHLRARDLWNCSTVSRLWQDVAKRELDTRGVVVKAGAFNKLFEECDSSTHISNYLTNKPMLGIFFNSLDRGYSECVARHFPLDSYCISVSNYGVIFNNEEHEKIENYSAFSLLPDDPDVDIDLITANHFSMILTNKKRGRFKSVSTAFWRSYGCTIGAIYQSFRSSVRRLRQVKCVIIFVNQNAECDAEPSIPDIFDKKVKVAWGGVCKDLTVMPVCKPGLRTVSKPMWLGVLISGRNVRCWSTILTEDDDTDEAIRKKLLELKEQVEFLKHTVAYMFACTNRGSELHQGRKNVEASIFKSIFPDVPLTGSFGSGEYGTYSEREYNSEDEGIFHQVSTTIMILSYGQTERRETRNGASF